MCLGMSAMARVTWLGPGKMQLRPRWLAQNDTEHKRRDGGMEWAVLLLQKSLFGDVKIFLAVKSFII